jgi:nitrite reductase/ring-hydroxylating ferredoxin subunit
MRSTTGAPTPGRLWPAGLTVTCPLHHWRFRLTDGAWADNPRLKTACYPVHVVGDLIQVEVPDKPAG